MIHDKCACTAQVLLTDALTEEANRSAAAVIKGQLPDGHLPS
jgi:hypothetical protein